MNAGSRVIIPSSVKNTIQNIKEIAGNHSDDEIYAMLKECNMDPNETTQKLLYQDTFHEVKRKRDKRKENSNNREPAWKPGMQGRGGRGGKGSYPSRYISQDASGGRNVTTGKENGLNQVAERGIVTQETESRSGIPASSVVSGAANVSAKGSTSQVAGGTGIVPEEESYTAETTKAGSTTPSPADMKSLPATAVSVPQGQPVLSDQLLSSAASISGVHASASDPVPVPSLDAHIPGTVGAIKHEGGSQQTVVEPPINKVVSHDTAGSELSSSGSERVVSEISSSCIQGKVSTKPQGYELNQVLDASQPLSSAVHSSSSGSRPSSNYSSRPQQVIGAQKAVGPSKEWKPKPANPNLHQASGTIGASDIPPVAVESSARSVPAENPPVSEESTSKLQKKLEELQFSDSQHVIFPNHLQVPEAERTGLSFGSFDASFGLGTSFVNESDSDKSSTPLSQSSQGQEENADEELVSSTQNAPSAAQEEEYSDRLQSPSQVPENLSSGVADISTNVSVVTEYDQSKQGALAPGGPQFPVHTTLAYSNFGLIPPVLGGQLAPFESSELQARDAARLQSFIVPQPFDPSSYYTQVYRPGTDSDGRISPFLAPSATKYNGNVAVLSSQTSQAPQEGMNSLVLPTTGPTPLSQAAGVMQSSIALTQQPVPLFRQSTGVHIPHYPPNYLPYSQYFSPFYVPSPTIHHFLSNTAFPQQPPSGSIYPSPAAAATTPVKYSLSQYKPGTNSGNSTHVGMPTGYVPYSSGPTAYSPAPAVTSGNSAGNEDLNASQYKENNIYISGQQSEGSGVWIPTPGRDIPGMQGGSFYNMPPQGQHMTFTPTQAGHGTFTGIYHPTQTVTAANVHPLLTASQTMTGAVEMVGPPAGVYQQPHRPQINWGNNY